MTLLVYVEHNTEAIDETSREALTTARQLSPEFQAVAVGNVASVAAQVERFGPSTLHVVEHEMLSDYAPEALGEALSQLIDSASALAMIGPGTDTGTEVLAQVAARQRVSLAANCTKIEAGEVWSVTRLRWGGMLLEDAELCSRVKLATVAQDAVTAVESGASPQFQVERFVPDLPDYLARTRVMERSTKSDGISLATAPVVVSGGRGVGSADGFAILEELAAEIRAAVGCSRVATNNGWRSHSDQVGQTGTRISPELYIACGISGATQHWAGCMGSKKILAINSDTEAPMVQRADYAVVGDLHTIVPAITEEIRRRKQARS